MAKIVPSRPLAYVMIMLKYTLGKKCTRSLAIYLPNLESGSILQGMKAIASLSSVASDYELARNARNKTIKKNGGFVQSILCSNS